MHKLRRKLYSQNFLKKPALARKLVGSSSICKNDLVLEIGPSKGIITDVLLERAQHVIAVEIDNRLYNYLEERYHNTGNITLHRDDILRFKLPRLRYKVFANIPFAIEGKIVRRLLNSAQPPEDCYLFMLRELAFRLCAFNSNNLFSAMHKPWFDFSIPQHFKKNDFSPSPSVNSVLFRFKNKKVPLLPENEKKSYQRFVRIGYQNGLPVYKNLRKLYGEKYTQKALSRNGLNKKSKPGWLSVEDWVGLYQLLSKALDRGHTKSL
ncbi:MAG: ribosomal RNA small subunit methyltransferase A [Candidatus Dojkabacteria bacterium]